MFCNARFVYYSSNNINNRNNRNDSIKGFENTGNQNFGAPVCVFCVWVGVCGEGGVPSYLPDLSNHFSGLRSILPLSCSQDK